MSIKTFTINFLASRRKGDMSREGDSECDYVSLPAVDMRLPGDSHTHCSTANNGPVRKTPRNHSKVKHHKSTSPAVF